jgi:hypothetical protein
MAEQDPERRPTPPPRSYSYEDLTNLTSQYLSSFGEMVRSDKPTEPAYSIGKGRRDDHAKLFINREMAMTTNAGRFGVGASTYFPTKNNQADFRFPSPPAWKYVTREQFLSRAKDRQLREQRPRYEYYQLAPEAQPSFDKARRAASAKPRRVSSAKSTGRPSTRDSTPGPGYYLTTRDQQAAPSFSFGYKRAIKGEDPLAVIGSTTPFSGPTSYFLTEKNQKEEILEVPNPKSKIIKYSIGKAKRFQ